MLNKLAKKAKSLVKSVVEYIGIPERLASPKVVLPIIGLIVLFFWWNKLYISYNYYDIYLELFCVILIVIFKTVLFYQIFKKQSCARFFLYLVVIGFTGASLLFHSIEAMWERHIRVVLTIGDNPVAFFAGYYIFMVGFGLIWIIASLHYDYKSAKLANSIINTALVIATTTFNLYIVSLPSNSPMWFTQAQAALIEEIAFDSGYSIKGIVQICVNSLLFAVIIIRLLASLFLDIKDYRRGKPFFPKITALFNRIQDYIKSSRIYKT